MPIAKEAGTSDGSARRPPDRHLRYKAHIYAAAPSNRLGGVWYDTVRAMGGWRGGRGSNE
jgi:hypothetical protein